MMSAPANPPATPPMMGAIFVLVDASAVADVDGKIGVAVTCSPDEVVIPIIAVVMRVVGLVTMDIMVDDSGIKVGVPEAVVVGI